MICVREGEIAEISPDFKEIAGEKRGVAEEEERNGEEEGLVVIKPGRLQLSSYPATTLVDKPSFFTPKYRTKGKAVVDEEGEDEAAQAIPDDSQPHRLLPSDSSQYKLQELPPNATSPATTLERSEHKDKQRHATQDLAAISRIRPCRCQKDDVVHRDNSPSSSGSGSSGTQGKKEVQETQRCRNIRAGGEE
ncbi:hypothetical protein Bca52824_076567 [Brassica carinata]|uniref:Uncharacterized protein n=1 Tax=Brassica carinata TaxID=52824 RepID=A0A8X7PUI5_BRACI|nr:hypothetical protein Bca52824_076567 [Brassica carinata]